MLEARFADTEQLTEKVNGMEVGETILAKRTENDREAIGEA
jgi:hypothetical protein